LIPFKVILTVTRFYKLRKQLRESGQDDTSNFDLIAHSRKLRMDVTVRDIYLCVFVALSAAEFSQNKSNSSIDKTTLLKPVGEICCERSCDRRKR